jgi:hypothetical protein
MQEQLDRPAPDPRKKVFDGFVGILQLLDKVPPEVGPVLKIVED